MRLAEAQAKESRATSNEGSFQTKFEADREARWRLTQSYN
ncbi:hypothetical protein PC123_g9289 [Phytophthora cactorum]|nr:hypothetical protein PC123_g9289 [Phytophthora cactorum]